MTWSLAGERGESHVRLGGVGTRSDDFRSGAAVGGEVELVLHDLEELDGLLGTGVVVDAGGVEIKDLPVEDLLAGPDVADAVQQFAPVAPSAEVLQFGVIHREALDEVLAQAFGGPDAELCSDLASDPVADRKDNVEVVVGQGASDLTGALLPNCSEFPNSCRWVDLALIEDVADVLADVGFRGMK